MHFFSLDDFVGHEIQTIVEDGEDHPEWAHGHGSKAGDEGQSVRPGSVVSNLEQRLDDVDAYQHGVGPSEQQQADAAAAADASAGCSSSGMPACSAAAAAAAAAASGLPPDEVAALLAMQYRDLTPADLQQLALHYFATAGAQQQQGQFAMDTSGAGPSSAGAGPSSLGQLPSTLGPSLGSGRGSFEPGAGGGASSDDAMDS